MACPTLVISNPPHDDVDTGRAASVLGLIAVEFRMKANYPVPEIWVADEDADAAWEAAGVLRDCGLHVVVVPGQELADAPGQRVAESFRFVEKGLAVEVGGSSLGFAYDDELLVLPCEPRAPEGVSVGPADAGDDEAIPEDATFTDVYASRGERHARVAIYQDFVDFSGLEGVDVPSHAAKMRHVERELESRFTSAVFDRRLAHMRLRRRPGDAVGGPAAVSEDTRKGYSFASRGLIDLLDSIDPALNEVSQAAFCSRLCWLTHRHGG